MSICQHIAHTNSETEVCVEIQGEWTFVYTWRADYAVSVSPVGQDYACALDVYHRECVETDHARANSERCWEPVQTYTWEASEAFDSSDELTPCERRDSYLSYIKQYPDNWVDWVAMQEAL